ncbi:hypothetical protein GCM10009785_33270 [Brooklawnia cerclae]|uniref:Dinitrogenase iron-molybdenum cofactor biosynthesis domain-containing protein n=1 Tax=Brooklawnia cerclae TaxID=349934 RepID=A0ABX0SBJ3_9ACTN|nr:Fe-only nitrogenase accessory AnfO family protein [Brooklawnia cerclae]NIH55757.1 hypothetical protein [Brooklawnia cerclae]
MKIAMLLDAAGRATHPEADGTLYVYERRGNDWVVSCTREHLAAGRVTVISMRGYLTGMCDWLRDSGCTVLAAQAPRGFGRLVFGRKNIDYWLVDGEPNNYLDEIEDCYLRREQAAAAAAQAAATS